MPCILGYNTAQCACKPFWLGAKANVKIISRAHTGRVDGKFTSTYSHAHRHRHVNVSAYLSVDLNVCIDIKSINEYYI